MQSIGFSRFQDMLRLAGYYDRDRPAVILDADGCVRPCSGSMPRPHAPPERLVKIIRALHPECGVVLCSGTTRCSLAQTVGHLALPTVLQIADYGLHIRLLDDGQVYVLKADEAFRFMSPAEIAAMAVVETPLASMFSTCKGRRDNRPSELLTWFFPDQDAYQTACRALLAYREDMSIPGIWTEVAISCNPGDFSINVKPKQSADKGVILRKLGIKPMVAAGDSGSDATMLRAAGYPILTHDEPPGVPHPKLADEVRKMGGYVAQTGRFHGHGLADGLQAAIDRRVLPRVAV